MDFQLVCEIYSFRAPAIDTLLNPYIVMAIAELKMPLRLEIIFDFKAWLAIKLLISDNP